jgi:hypothetical protein
VASAGSNDGGLLLLLLLPLLSLSQSFSLVQVTTSRCTGKDGEALLVLSSRRVLVLLVAQALDVFHVLINNLLHLGIILESVRETTRVLDPPRPWVPSKTLLCRCESGLMGEFNVYISVYACVCTG